MSDAGSGPVEVILIRHGESVGNQLKVVQGISDYELSEHGRKQAELTGLALKEFKADKIFSSPMLRACQTAKAIGAAQGTEVAALDLIREIDLGLIEGLTMAEVRVKFPEVFKKIPEVGLVRASPGAESDESIKARAREAVKLLSSGEYPRVIVVAHLGILEHVMVRLIRKVMDIDHKLYFPAFLKNCGITRLRIDGKDSKMEEFNNTEHLKGMYGD